MSTLLILAIVGLVIVAFLTWAVIGANNEAIKGGYNKV